jgi:hypothetical protein
MDHGRNIDRRRSEAIDVHAVDRPIRNSADRRSPD